MPEAFALLQNHPNPFNAMTDIRYQIADGRSPVHTALKIYNVLGQEVRMLVDAYQDGGYYSITWDGRDDRGNGVPSGVYLYRLSVDGGEWSEVREMVLIR
jgi:flagellar hook assembly protein FlgD